MLLDGAVGDLCVSEELGLSLVTDLVKEMGVLLVFVLMFGLEVGHSFMVLGRLWGMADPLGDGLVFEPGSGECELGVAE